MISDVLQPKGTFHFLLKDKDGNVKDEWNAENRFVDQGLAIINTRLLATAPDALPDEIQLGTSGTAWNRTHTSCQTAIVTADFDQQAADATWPKVVTKTVTNDTYEVKVTFTSAGTYTGVQEACIRSVTPKCLCRTTFTPRNIVPTDVLVVTYQMQLIP